MRFPRTLALPAALAAIVSAMPHATQAQDAPVLSTVQDRIEEFIQNHEISGAVTVVAGPNQILHCSASGLADIEGQKAMKPDTIFWIASMTKPITGTAIMMLQEAGKLSIDDPVEKYLPEFQNLKMADGTPAHLTIQHLLTHTSGMSDVSGNEVKGIENLAGLIPLYVSKPVLFKPGSKWSYCQSGINTAGRIVEVVSGQPFEKFVEDRLFRPLGMNDTTFYLSEAQMQRLATSYKRTNAGTLEPASISILGGKSPTSRNRFPAANGGLFSTGPDYARFCQMILNKGELDGKRYLEPATVEQMTTIHTGDIKTGFTDGNGWGIGWCVIRAPQGLTAMLSPGTCGHGGAYGTQAWVDPVQKRAYILMVQRSNFPNSDASEVRRAFQQAAADSLGAPK